MSLAAATALPSHIYASETLAGTGPSRPFGYKRSVSHWTVAELEWEDLCPWLADQGIEAIDLVGPDRAGNRSANCSAAADNRTAKL